MSMTVQVAHEHIKDGSDCIAEALRSIKRVQKNFPATGEQISVIEAHLTTARLILQATAQTIAEPRSP